MDYYDCNTVYQASFINHNTPYNMASCVTGQESGMISRALFVVGGCQWREIDSLIEAKTTVERKSTMN